MSETRTTEANKSTVAVPPPIPKRRWGWAEIYWSKPDKSKEIDWETGNYHRPVFERYNEQKVMKDLLELPAEYRDKTLSELHAEFDTTPDICLDLKDRLEAQIKKLTKTRDAIVCSFVRQWVIVEIQPITGVEYAFDEALPYFSMWGFLQPDQIGNSVRMKDERGYVTDDIPRSGWFEATVGWEKVGGKWQAIMVETVRKGKDTTYRQVHDIHYRLAEDEYPTGKHIKHPSYGRGIRFQFKIPVTIRNYLTIDDLEAKKNAVEKIISTLESDHKPSQDDLVQAGLPIDKEISQLTTKQQNELLRLEKGSWLKIWVRNACFDWLDAEPKDDRTENCMKVMHNLDNHEIHPDKLLTKPQASFVSEASCEKGFDAFYKDYLEWKNSSGGNTTDKKSDDPEWDLSYKVKQDATARWSNINEHRIMQMEHNQVKEPELSLFFGDEPAEAEVKGDPVRLPEYGDEEEADSCYYKVGKDTFRPRSFRNHVWIRNKMGEGPNLSDPCIHICLWPEELISSLAELPSKLFKFDPEKNKLPQILIFSLFYALLLKLLSDSVEKLDSKKREQLLKFIKESEFHKHAAVLACNGLPMSSALKWYPDKTYEDIVSDFNEKIEKDQQPEATVLSFYETALKSLAMAIIESKGMKGDYESVRNIYDRHCEKVLGKTKTLKNAQGPSFDFEDILKGKVKLNVGNADIAKIHKVGVIPQIACAWVLHSKAQIGGDIEVDFARILQKILTFTANTSGDAGIYFDFGLVTVILDKYKDHYLDTDTSSRSEIPDSPFFEVIDDLLRKLGAEVGAHAKVTMTGDSSFNLNFSPERKSFFSFAEGSDQELVIKIEVPVTAKIWGTMQTLGKLSLKLMNLSRYSLVFIPEGIRGEWIRLTGRWNFGKISGAARVYGQKMRREIRWTDTDFIEAEIIDKPKQNTYTYCLGEDIKVEAKSIGVPDKDLQSQLYTLEGEIALSDGKEFAFETKEKHTRLPVSSRVPHDLITEIDTKFDLLTHILDDKNNLYNEESPEAAFIISLLGGKKQDFTLDCSFAGDNRKFNISVPSPQITNFRILSPKPWTTKQTIEISFRVKNWKYTNKPLYVTMFEIDLDTVKLVSYANHPLVRSLMPDKGLAGALSKLIVDSCDSVRNLGIEPLLDSSKKAFSAECETTDASKNEYRARINLQEIGNVDQVVQRLEYIFTKNMDLSFLISIDRKGELPIMQDNGVHGGIMSKDYEILVK